VLLDADRCYRACEAKDARFDGWFFVGVRTTGIYCRPSCPARTPAPGNVEFHPTAAAAQRAGFRACKRCRPDAAPGSPEWDPRGDVVARAMRLVADGVVDREGVRGLAARLAYSERQVHRLLVAEVGAGPLALARAQRAQTARILLETTALPVTEVAFASGFASIRQFNDTIRTVFAVTPTQLRRRARHHDAAAPGVLALRLPVRAPFAGEELIGFLADRAVAGVEEVDGGTYRRSLALPHGAGTVALTPAADHVRAELRLDDLRDLTAAVQRCRRLLDLDADPLSVAAVLGSDPLLRREVRAHPGRRVPGHPDGHELLVRAILGQQVSVAGARTLAGRLVARWGKPLDRPDGALTHRFPDAHALAEADLDGIGLTGARVHSVRAVSAAVADGTLPIDPGVDRDELRTALQAQPGVGPWTAEYVLMRAVGDPDAFLASDLGVRRALDGFGVPSAPRAALARADAWRPWRAYATVHLWSLPTPVKERSR
jgi:AraC family transcriptional regulator of adaptative response / DNA-3-methyladenine glycosylase II